MNISYVKGCTSENFGKIKEGVDIVKFVRLVEVDHTSDFIEFLLHFRSSIILKHNISETVRYRKLKYNKLKYNNCNFLTIHYQPSLNKKNALHFIGNSFHTFLRTHPET